MKSILSALIGASLACGAIQANAEEPTLQKVQLDIARQSLTAALNAWAEQTGFQLVCLAPDVARGLVAPTVKGAFTATEALEQLLAGSPLTYEFTSERMVTVRARFQSAYSVNSTLQKAEQSLISRFAAVDQETRQGQPGSARAGAAGREITRSRQEPTSGDQGDRDSELEEVVVTGTHIRGVAPNSSPVTIYDRKMIDQSGAATVAQFARKMQENFSGADTIANFNSNAIHGRFSQGANDNFFNGAAFNLRGLGTTSTLTLLNGHRISPAGSGGLVTDISLIPLSAVEHIEVLSDGASAIYGADAVAGVVNIVTRKDFEGAETALRYGSSTDGGGAQFVGSQLLGTSWNSGNALLSYEYDKQHALDASDRNYIFDQGGPYSLIPENRRNSAFFTARQTFGAATHISADGIYSEREFAADLTAVSDFGTLASVSTGEVNQKGLTLTLQQPLSNEWEASVSGNYSSIDQRAAIEDLSIDALTINDVESSIAGVDALLNGPIASLAAGELKMAVGASFRSEEFNSRSRTTFFGITTEFGGPRLERDVSSAFLEVLVPIVGPSTAGRLPQVELSAAVRYDDYSDFGSSSNPKVGLVWRATQSLSLRSTYGTSFRAPPLTRIGGTVFSRAQDLPDPASPIGLTDTLFVSGGNPNLRPEESRSFTAGIDFKPQASVSLALTYFSTRFEDRIAAPVTVGLPDFGDPFLAPFLLRDPSLAEVDAYFNSPGFQGDIAGDDFLGRGPGAVELIFNNQAANIAMTEQSGIDFSARFDVPTERGDFDFGISGTRLLENDLQTVSNAPSLSLIDTFAQPTAWKVQGSLGWSRGGFEANTRVNYVNGYDNAPFAPRRDIGSWTTADLYIAYSTGEAGGLLPSGTTIALSIQNVTDEKPPFVAVSPDLLLPGQNPISYDPANASPLGRFIAVQLNKRW